MEVESNGLKKVLGRWDSIAIVVAIVIGVGIFRTPSEVAQYLSSPWLILLAWIVGGVISLAGALCYAELSSSFPETGGSYVYLKKSYGSLAAFLFGWAELLVIKTGSIAAIAFIFSEHLVSFLSLNSFLVKSIAVVVIVLLGLINIAGLRYGKNTQNIFVLIKIAALVIIIVLGFFSGKGDFTHFQLSSSHFPQNSLTFFGLALIPILWTYGGWHENVFVAGETKDAARTLPFALIRGLLIVTALYIAVNALYIYLFTIAEIRQSELIASSTFSLLYGVYGRKIFEAIVIISSFASINAMIMTGSRVTYAMAKDNPIFKYMQEVSRITATPHRAILVTLVWSIVLVIWGSFSRLLFFTGFLVWAFFALVAAGLFVLRRKYPKMKRPYSVWLYPFTPFVFVAVSVCLVVITFSSYTVSSLIGLAILLSGIPVYFISNKIK